jgi:NAD(P)-dependent dehydrogenase (short-subunit alcohol dehydrogenase family)
MRVSIVSRSPAASEGSPFFGARADVTEEAQIRRAFEECREANGPIGVLVNSAGIAESAPLARTDRAMWDRIIATNLTGTFLCTLEAIRDMTAAQWGRIVNVASIAGLVGAPYISAYSASKHGVVGFTRAIAAEFFGSEITANAVCPGYTETEMMHRAIGNIIAKTGRSDAEARELLARGNPEGRIATAEEVANGIWELINGTRTGVALVIPGFMSS